MNSISFASTGGNSISSLRLKIGATVGGTPSFTPISGTTANNGLTITAGNSISSFDVAATTYTAGTGTYIYGTSIQTGNFTVDLTPNDIFIAPGEILSINGFAANTATIGCTVTFTEDI